MAAHTALAGWSEPRRISEPGGHATPQIIAQGDTLHVVAEEFNLTDKIGYWRSTDGGLTWNQAQVLSDRSDATLFPRIIQSGNRLMVLWKKSLSGYYRYTIAYNTSTDNGQSWQSYDRFVLENGSPENLFFSASGGAGSNISLVYLTYVSPNIVFYSVRSTDFGESWSSPREMFRALQNGQVDIAGSDSTIHFTWDGRFDWSRVWETRYLRSTDGGLSWSENQLLSSDDLIRSIIPSISADRDGGVAVCWTDGKYSPHIDTGDILGRHSPDSGLTWGSESQASTTHFAWGSDIAMSGDTMHIAWMDEGTGIAHRSIYYTRSTDSGETWEEPFWIDRTLDDSWDPALATSQGRAYIFWADSRYEPDSSRGGLYFSRYDPEPNAIEEGEESLPKEAGLFVYPNPFNSSISITYAGMKGGEIRIYDIKGALVKTLEVNESGEGKIIWDATDASGKKVCSGTYFARGGEDDSSRGVRLIYLK